MSLGSLLQGFARQNPHLVVIDPEKCCSWLRNFESDDRNIGFLKEMGQLSSDSIVNLKFNDQVYTLLDERLSIAKCSLGAVVIADLDQIDLVFGSGPAETLTHCI